ncbi:hypothetical protein AGMMS4956_04910 [Bacteroidia bacterium]|nr:hypothetical protein AGMMS4956_04910 [Bacteroidia bacterium]
MLVLTVCVVAATSCKKKDDKDNIVPITGITLTPATQTLTVGGQSGKLTPTITPDNATDQKVKWNVEPIDVIIVADDGSIIAIKEGEAIVTATAGGKTAAANVKVNAAIPAATFPDVNFQAFVIEIFDTNKDGVISTAEVAAVSEIRCDRKNIASLEGIEVFTALTYLDCGFNQLTTLDVSKNTALTDLSCGDNPLTVLDVSKNTALTYLTCDNNQLTATALDALFNSLPTVTNGEIYTGSNPGTSTCDQSIATGKGWTVNE